MHVIACMGLLGSQDPSNFPISPKKGTYPLLLSAAEPEAPLTHHGVVVVGEAVNYGIVDGRGFCSCLHLLP